MYEDVSAADAMLSRLADLLRRTLRRPGGRDVPLAEELETLISISPSCEPGSRIGCRWTSASRTGRGTRGCRRWCSSRWWRTRSSTAIRGPAPPRGIAIRARRDDGRLLLEVEDNGPGLAGPPDEAAGRGIGLGTTARRLEHLYGARAGVTSRICRAAASAP